MALDISVDDSLSGPSPVSRLLLFLRLLCCDSGFPALLDSGLRFPFAGAEASLLSPEAVDDVSKFLLLVAVTIFASRPIGLVDVVEVVLLLSSLVPSTSCGANRPFAAVTM